MPSKFDVQRKIICEFVKSNPGVKRSEIVKHFLKQNFKKWFIYNTLRKIENSLCLERKVGSGRKCSLSDPKNNQRLKQATVGKVAKSYRELGRKFHCDKNTIKKYLNKLGIERKSRKVKSKVTKKQVRTQKTRLRKLVNNKFFAKNKVCCIQDDETYFTLDGNEWQGKHYFTDGKDKIKPSVQFTEKEKFPRKILLWLAISEKGMSQPYFFESNLAVNAEKYQKFCLPKVAKFIASHHKNDIVVFWPDLASAHYAKSSLAVMDSLNIPYVPKEENPPNVPQLRPIEDFWANLKRRVYANNFRPKSTQNLKVKIQKELRNMPTSFFSNAMRKVPSKCRKAERLGVNYFIH